MLQRSFDDVEQLFDPVRKVVQRLQGPFGADQLGAQRSERMFRERVDAAYLFERRAQAIREVCVPAPHFERGQLLERELVELRLVLAQAGQRGHELARFVAPGGRLLVCGYGGDEVLAPLREWGFEPVLEREWLSSSGSRVQLAAIGVPG